MTFSQIAEHIMNLSILIIDHILERRKQPTDEPYEPPQAETDLDDFLATLPTEVLCLLLALMRTAGGAIQPQHFAEGLNNLREEYPTREQLLDKLFEGSTRLAASLPEAAERLCTAPETFPLFAATHPDTRKPLPKTPDTTKLRDPLN